MHRLLRLRTSRDFQHVRESGKSYHHSMLWISIVENKYGHNRYGFITNKRIGKAIVRNRVKRLMREHVRRLHPMLQQGYDVVVIARPQLAQKTYLQYGDALQAVFRQAGLLLQ